MMSTLIEGEQGETDQSVTYDECFDLLSNHRRRYTLHYLKQNGEAVTLSDLSETVAAWENGIPVEELSYDERKRVYTSLQQVHLPRMDDAGVVSFDDREGVVEVGPAAEELDIYLEVVQRGDIPWSMFYVGLGVFNLLVVTASVIGVPGVSALPQVGIAVFVVTTFLVTALSHLYVTRTEMQLGADEQPPEVGK
jgi:hypothetical protein